MFDHIERYKAYGYNPRNRPDDGKLRQLPAFPGHRPDAERRGYVYKTAAIDGTYGGFAKEMRDILQVWDEEATAHFPVSWPKGHFKRFATAAITAVLWKENLQLLYSGTTRVDASMRGIDLPYHRRSNLPNLRRRQLTREGIECLVDSESDDN